MLEFGTTGTTFFPMPISCSTRIEAQTTTTSNRLSNFVVATNMINADRFTGEFLSADHTHEAVGFHLKQQVR